MNEPMPKMTIAEMGETLVITRYVGMWGEGGDMRAFVSGDPSPPRSPLERGALIAFDAIQPDEGANRTEKGRGELLDLLSNGLRIAVVEERENGQDGRSDVDRARLVLVSMAMILAARDHADGLEPSPLENQSLEAMRRKSGMEASAFSRSDASALGVGMADMIEGEAANFQVRQAIQNALTPSRDLGLENRLAGLEATWPQAEVRPAEQAISAAKGADRSGSGEMLQQAANARSEQGR